MISFPLIFSTFIIIFVAELPDKTALAALILATKYRARDVIVGACLAFLVQTVVGVAAGSIFTLLPLTPIRIASGIGFLVFAALAFLRKEEELEKEEKTDIARAKSHRPIWLVSFLVIFAAEWGDLTQLATAALVAQNRHPFSVGIGAVLALWTVTILAAVSGARLSRFLKPKLLNAISGLLFGAIGIYLIATALGALSK
jgi:putative Ca2+/H+ antiporter (TMEM165/GDT1 family)